MIYRFRCWRLNDEISKLWNNIKFINGGTVLLCWKKEIACNLTTTLNVILEAVQKGECLLLMQVLKFNLTTNHMQTYSI